MHTGTSAEAVVLMLPIPPEGFDAPLEKWSVPGHWKTRWWIPVCQECRERIWDGVFGQLEGFERVWFFERALVDPTPLDN
ncbi:hypothetical protein IU459_11895 [Nocardia amamiensis]|uniref:Uncharacterized protein n=1 Tax=Nocardia amamiensis TaxID=404578 RepID=A0ABS0CU05_9NOCA|nr:hypothetical protein [Nocardia amamiensis]MBF6298243.1 hypothetical protein [Nocardia amamiensis]